MFAGQFGPKMAEIGLLEVAKWPAKSEWKVLTQPTQLHFWVSTITVISVAMSDIHWFHNDWKTAVICTENSVLFTADHHDKFISCLDLISQWNFQ